MPTCDHPTVLDTMLPLTATTDIPTIDQETQTAPLQFAPADGVGFFRKLVWDTVELRSVLEEGQQLQRFELPDELQAQLRDRRASRAPALDV